MEKKIIKGEFNKLKDRLSNLADTYENKAYDDAINKLYDRLDDLSKEKVKILTTIRKLETQKCVKNIKAGDCFIEEDTSETTEIFQVLDMEEEEVVTCLVVGRYNIYKNSFKVTDTKYWKPITRNQFNSLYQAVLIDLNDSKYHLEHITNWDKEIKNFL
jgi:hypothetical protein